VTTGTINAWINQILAANSSRAASVADRGFPRLPQFFQATTLRNARFVITNTLPIPRLSQFGLEGQMDELPADSEGITLDNTFFVLEGHADDEALFFHELVHVLQWQMLGRERFISLYLRGLAKHGYRSSPLEKMAYSLQEEFERGTAPFSVEMSVSAGLGSM
jgi:hypothetical protein